MSMDVTQFGLSRTHVTLIVLFVIFQLLDVASTRLALLNGMFEANFVPSLIIANHGEEAMYVFKLLIVFALLGLVIVLRSRFSRLWHAVRIINVITCLIVISNLAQVLALA